MSGFSENGGLVAPNGGRRDEDRLVHISLDACIPARDHNVEQEREVAIRDLLECNHFQVLNGSVGPYTMTVSMVGIDAVGATALTYIVATRAFRRVMCDYAAICGSLIEARSRQDPKVEAIDMTRRAIHDEASCLLRDRLSSKVVMDYERSRRLFTVLFAYVWRGAFAPLATFI